MGNKNLILVFAVLILWFLVIRPLSKEKEEKKSESKTEIKPDSGALTPASNTTPEFTEGMTRYYTV